MLKIGDKDAKGLYYGSSAVVKAFWGSEQVWPSLPYDAEVQWLEAPYLSQAYRPTHYIDTGVKAETGYVATMDVQSSSSLVENGVLLGAVFSGQRLHHFAAWPTGNFFIGYNGSYKSQAGYAVNTRYLLTSSLKNGSQTLFVNGEQKIQLSTAGNLSFNGNFYLFCVNDNGNPRFQWAGKLFRVTLAKDGVVARDFIPVRFTNENGVSEGAMYDKVTKQLFRNNGTGSFVVGPDVKSSTRMLIDVTTSLNPTDKYWIYPQISSSVLDTQTYRAALQALGWSVDVPSDHIYEMALGDNIQVLSSSSPYEDGWFYGYPNLSAVNLNKATTAVGRLDYGTFGACSALVKVDLGKNLSSVGAGMFRNCSSLKKLKVPSSAKSVGDTFIGNCPSLERLQLSEGLERIEDYAFGYGNTKLKSIELPSTLSSIGIAAIIGETSAVTFNSSQPETPEDGTSPFQADDYSMLLYAKPNTSWNIPIPGTWYNQYINWKAQGETTVLDTNGRLSSSVAIPSEGGRLNISFYKNHESVSVNSSNVTIDGKMADGNSYGMAFFNIGQGTQAKTVTIAVNQPTTIDVENVYTRNRNLIPFQVNMTNTIYLSSFLPPGHYWRPDQLSTITQYMLSTESGIDPTVHTVAYQDDQTINGTYRYYPTGNTTDMQFYICPAIGSPYFVENQPWIHFPDFGEVSKIEFTEEGALMTPTFKMPAGSRTMALLSTLTKIDRKDDIRQDFQVEIQRT